MRKFFYTACKIFILGCCVSLSACQAPVGQAGYLTETGQMGLAGAVGGAAASATMGGVALPGVGVIAGGMIGTTLGYMLERDQTLLQRLANEGVHVFAVGDSLLLVSSMDLYFVPNTLQRRHGGDVVIQDIAKLLRHYEKITVKMSVFNDQYCGTAQAKMLTEQQGQALVDLLWQFNPDVRMLFAQGYGCKMSAKQHLFAPISKRHFEISLNVLPSVNAEIAGE